VLSDRIVVQITSNPGESFLDRMISLVEGASRQKTPNEIALDILIAGMTLILLVAVVTLQPMAIYDKAIQSTAVLIALFVCLAPTTIGGLLSAIGIAGMDRMVQRNVLAMSGRAVEAAGDCSTLLLDKTGTITYGNRMATEFLPVTGVTVDNLAEAALLSSMPDETPALAQADVGLAMNTGTQAAKEAGNMVDLDSNPTKLIEVVEVAKQLLITRGSLTTFSIANDVAKYFAIIPAMFVVAYPKLRVLNVMHLDSPHTAILSAVIYNAVIIPAMIPLALRGVKFRPRDGAAILRRNALIYGVGGIIAPFVFIKLIDLTEIMYAYASVAQNNGSAFAGLAANTPWYDITLGLTMLIGRFAPIVLALAIAGSLAGARVHARTRATLDTVGLTFAGFLVGVIVIVGGLIYFPMLILGPVGERIVG